MKNPITSHESKTNLQESKINETIRQDEIKLLFESSEEACYV